MLFVPFSQWSAGGFFHPDVVGNTQAVYLDYDLANHVEWEPFAPLLGLPPPQLLDYSNQLVGYSKGTDISGAKIDIYKHNGVVLTSLFKFRCGFQAGQAWPWAATVGDIAVWTQSGIDNFLSETSRSNSHLPCINQNKNVALIVYHPSASLKAPLTTALFGQLKTKVLLNFPTAQFDSYKEDGNWIMGSRNENYIAVWRDENYEVDNNGVVFSDFLNDNDLIQVWAVVVGNHDTHGPFESFMAVIREGTVVYNLTMDESNYWAKLEVDGKRVYLPDDNISVGDTEAPTAAPTTTPMDPTFSPRLSSHGTSRNNCNGNIGSFLVMSLASVLLLV